MSISYFIYHWQFFVKCVRGGGQTKKTAQTHTRNKRHSIHVLDRAVINQLIKHFELTLVSISNVVRQNHWTAYTHADRIHQFVIQKKNENNQKMRAQCEEKYLQNKFHSSTFMQKRLERFKCLNWQASAISAQQLIDGHLSWTLSRTNQKCHELTQKQSND